MSRRIVISETPSSRASSPTWIVCCSATRFEDPVAPVDGEHCGV